MNVNRHTDGSLYAESHLETENGWVCYADPANDDLLEDAQKAADLLAEANSVGEPADYHGLRGDVRGVLKQRRLVWDIRNKPGVRRQLARELDCTEEQLAALEDWKVATVLYLIQKRMHDAVESCDISELFGGRETPLSERTCDEIRDRYLDILRASIPEACGVEEVAA